MKQQVSEAVVRRRQFLKVSPTPQGSICVWVSWPATLFETSIQLFSCEIYKISKNTILKNSYSGCFWGLTRVFKGVHDKNRCLRHKPVLAEKGICCSEKPEAATVGVLKRRPNKVFIKNRLQYCEIFKNIVFKKTSVNGCLWKSALNFPKEGFLFNLLAS